MGDDDPKIGDHLRVFIDRESKSGNLICRRSPEYHVVKSNQHTPRPHQKWVVEVISEPPGVFYLTPIEQLDTYPRDAPEPKDGDGTNPFKNL